MNESTKSKTKGIFLIIVGSIMFIGSTIGITKDIKRILAKKRGN